jgi:hypothetical protein
MTVASSKATGVDNEKPLSNPTSNHGPDSSVPDPAVRREFGICEMTLTRWSADPKLHFPPPIKINNRCYRSRRLLDVFKADLLRKSIADRARVAMVEA